MGRVRRQAVHQSRRVRCLAAARPAIRGRARAGVSRTRLAFARRLHDRAVRIHELHVVHRPAAGVRIAGHPHRVRRVVGRHGRLDDRCAGAGHAGALLDQVRGRLVAIRGRHGRVARRDDRALSERGRRMVGGVAQPAGEALAHRRDARRARRDVRIAPLLRIDVLREVRDRLAVHEGGRRYGRDRVRRAEIDVRVVDVGDVRHVHGLVHVDVVHHDVLVHAVVVARAPAAPARMPALARAEREPRAARRGGPADREADAPVEPAAASSADERDQRRRIDGRLADHDRARHPRPAVVDIRPAAVVIRREAPRRIIDPGPAPRRLPDPVPVVIGRPVGRRVVRHPYGAVARVVAPRAVRVEVLVAGDVARHVTGRHRAVLGRVAIRGPLVERVVGGRARLLRDLQAGAGEDHLLPGRQRVLAAVAIDGRAAAPHGDRRARAVRRDVDAVVAGARDAEREVRRIDFVRRAGRQRAHVRRHGAEADLQLRRRVVEVHHRQARRFAEPYGARADVQLGACTRVVPELVAGRERPVHGGIRPRIGAGRLGRHRARQVIEPRDAARRVAARLPGGRGIRRRGSRLRERGRQRGECREREQREAGGAREREVEGHDERCRCPGASIRADEFTISARAVSVLCVL